MKVVALDLDGTLLNRKKEISMSNQKRIQKLRKQGVKVVLASGRSATAMRYYYNQLGLNEPMICCNGGYVVNPLAEEVIASRSIKKKDLQAAAELLRQEAAYYLVYTATTLWMSSIRFSMDQWIFRNRELAPQDQVDIRVREDLESLFDEEPIYKLFVFCVNEEEKQERIQLLRRLPGLEVSDSLPGAIDLMRSGVTKADGLKDIAEYYGISMGEIAFMGDHNNDVEALKQAGLGVAMGNATEAARNAADWLTDDHDEDGVKTALDRLFGV